MINDAIIKNEAKANQYTQVIYSKIIALKRRGHEIDCVYASSDIIDFFMMYNNSATSSIFQVEYKGDAYPVMTIFGHNLYQITNAKNYINVAIRQF